MSEDKKNLILFDGNIQNLDNYGKINMIKFLGTHEFYRQPCKWVDKPNRHFVETHNKRD